MSVPKSVIKIKKNGVEYVSNVDRCKYFIFELCRAALRDCGKLLKRRFRESYYSHFQRRTGNAGRAAKYKIYSSKNTKYPRMDIGLAKGAKKGYYAFFQETGTKKQPKKGLLTKAVSDNIQEMQKIQAKYLSALENEANAASLIDEREYESKEGEEE